MPPKKSTKSIPAESNTESSLQECQKDTQGFREDIARALPHPPAQVSVCGGGAWGSALAYALAHSTDVCIASRRTLSIPSDTPCQILQVDCASALSSHFVVIAISTPNLRKWLSLQSKFLQANTKYLFASKGIEEGSGAFVHTIALDFIPKENLAFLSGPSFAAEVRAKLPCALAIHAYNDEVAKDFAKFFPSFIKPYTGGDVIGAEVSGAYKNVLAIAGGICDELKLGHNAKAALLARGLIEMERFGRYFGGESKTFLGLEGAGDLFLSANSTLSRNYRVGVGLAQGKDIDSILCELGEVAEGVRTAYAIQGIAKKHDIYTPIVNEVVGILQGKSCKEGILSLMSR